MFKVVLMGGKCSFEEFRNQGGFRGSCICGYGYVMDRYTFLNENISTVKSHCKQLLSRHISYYDIAGISEYCCVVEEYESNVLITESNIYSPACGFENCDFHNGVLLTCTELMEV